MRRRQEKAGEYRRKQEEAGIEGKSCREKAEYQEKKGNETGMRGKREGIARKHLW
jgi:hypothetical protein